MTKISFHKYATPRNQRVREFVREKMGNAFLLGYFVGAAIALLYIIFNK